MTARGDRSHIRVARLTGQIASTPFNGSRRMPLANDDAALFGLPGRTLIVGRRRLRPSMKADKELAEFKQISAGPVESSFHYHHARLVEAMYGIEKIEQILNDPQILDKHVRATAGVNRLEGAGQIEAPRGTLNHHYKVNENGQMTWASLVVATGHNNNAMNRGVLQAARKYVKDGKFSEGALNRVEAVIRTFDPCLSCSTHAFGQMPLAMTLVSSDGEVVDQVVR